MDIELHEITVKELFDGYKNEMENGVVGYGGRLDIRPAYQREFIYSQKESREVINTVIKKFPLNTMYWVDKGDDKYELLDGQQRTISICSFLSGDFSIMINGNPQYFHLLDEDTKKDILGYKLMVYFCKGTTAEQLEWFKVINIAGLRLTDQELRNAVYTGSWLTDAKKYFSKRNCPAYGISSSYVKADLERQGYLELALKWFTNGNIEEYMAKHRRDLNANELWTYYSAVFTWVKMIFKKTRKQMAGLPWGEYYNKYHTNQYDADTLEKQITKLLKDADVTKKSGIYAYLLSGEEKYLNIRAFDENMRLYAYENQNHKCKRCGKEFDIEDMDADHIKPWVEGGKTVAENCQMLCKNCNRSKSCK